MRSEFYYVKQRILFKSAMKDKLYMSNFLLCILPHIYHGQYCSLQCLSYE